LPAKIASPNLLPIARKNTVFII